MTSKILFVLLLWAACIGQGLAQGGSYADSPFALQAPFENKNLSVNKEINFLKDVGIKQVRLLPTELKECASLLSENNIQITAGIAQPVFPNDMEKYKNEVKEIVKKYKNYVKAWLIVNEADLMWKNTLEKYAEYFIATSHAIKTEDPDAKTILCLAGTKEGEGASQRGLSFLDFALKNGVGQYFDILDIHVQGDAGNYKFLDNVVSEYGEIFIKNGVNEKSIWITEFGTYDGDPDDKVGRLPFPYQSELVQAGGLIKKYIYGLLSGVDKMFWTTMTEWDHYNGNSLDYFSNVGLINNAGNDGQSHKKLAYYAYKKMVEVLEGSDWKNIATVQEQNGIYIYKFTKQGTPIWVAWNDSSVTRTITISGITSNRVRATEAVPKYESGKEVADYTTAFQTDTLVVTNGAAALTLGQRPVFIEPLTVTSVEYEGENIPKEFLLYQNYPNPFNPTTTISFSIPHAEHVILKVYDLLGREIGTLVNEELNPGEHSVVFNATELASGVYFYRLTTPTFSQTKSLMVLK